MLGDHRLLEMIGIESRGGPPDLDQVPENPPEFVGILNDGDTFHIPAALLTHHRINLSGSSRARLAAVLCTPRQAFLVGLVEYADAVVYAETGMLPGKRHGRDRDRRAHINIYGRDELPASRGGCIHGTPHNMTRPADRFLGAFAPARAQVMRVVLPREAIWPEAGMGAPTVHGLRVLGFSGTSGSSRIPVTSLGRIPFCYW